MLAPLVAMAALAIVMAVPAVSSAQTWVETTGEPLGSYSANGATGYDDRATATVSGHIEVYKNWTTQVTIDMECDVTGEVELWNDGEGYAPGKNQVISLDDTDCGGSVGPNCPVSGITSNNLSWAGDMSYYGSPGAFSGVDIDWSLTGCGSLGTTGVLEVTNVLSPTTDCLEGFQLDDGPMSVEYGIGSADVTGTLEIESIDGLSSVGDPDCVLEF